MRAGQVTALTAKMLLTGIQILMVLNFEQLLVNEKHNQK